MLIDEILELLSFEPRLIVNDELEVAVKYSGDLERVGRELGAKVDILDCTYAIIRTKAEIVTRIGSFDAIEAIELPKTLSIYAERGKTASCIPNAYSAPYGLSGENTLVAVIDSGIDVFHPEFLDENGKSRILAAWDMTLPPDGNNTYGFETFGIGKVWKKSEIDEFIADDKGGTPPLFDPAGHGTAVAAIAAGRLTGVAKKSGIVFVKAGNAYQGRGLFSRTTELMRALRFVSDAEKIFGMPVSVNLSYGTNNGGHNGASVFESYVDVICESKNTVVSAATGNEGDTGHHFSGICKTGETAEILFAASGAGDRFYITLWKNFADTVHYTLVSPTGDTSPVLLPQNRFYPLRLGRIRVSVFFEQPAPYTYSQEIYFVFESENGIIPEGVWTLKAEGIDVADGRFDAWLPTVEDVGNSTSFLSPDRELTLTLPSTSNGVISVGGYDGATGSPALFSGRGFTRDNVYVKPDLIAPAVDIVSAAPNGGYGSFSGTSMACPFVCGAASLLLEWGIARKNDLFLYGQRAKAFLRKGASRVPGISYPDEAYGYGRLCLSKTLSLLEQYDGGGRML